MFDDAIPFIFFSKRHARFWWWQRRFPYPSHSRARPRIDPHEPWWWWWCFLLLGLVAFSLFFNSIGVRSFFEPHILNVKIFSLFTV